MNETITDNIRIEKNETFEIWITYVNDEKIGIYESAEDANAAAIVAILSKGKPE